MLPMKKVVVLTCTNCPCRCSPKLENREGTHPKSQELQGKKKKGEKSHFFGETPSPEVRSPISVIRRTVSTSQRVSPSRCGRRCSNTAATGDAAPGLSRGGRRKEIWAQPRSSRVRVRSGQSDLVCRREPRRWVRSGRVWALA